MRQIKAILGYSAAVLTVIVALLTPFLLFGVLRDGVAATGLQIDPVYTGGPPVQHVSRDGYEIVVHGPVHPAAPLSRTEPFVQLVWKPREALPPHITDDVDIDGDGRADIAVSFDSRIVPPAPLTVSVTPLREGLSAMRDVAVESFSRLIAQTDDAVIVRIPMRPR